MTGILKTTLPPYFFLSYARSDPLAGFPEENPDYLVEQFYRDLSNAVQALAKRTAFGFFDQHLPAGSDLKLSITQAISTTQAFVPLYTVSYLTNSWPGREFAYFANRLELAGRTSPAQRLVPVLWAPLAGVDEPPGLRNAPGVRAGRDYAENGLRALLKLKYSELYQDVVRQVAHQIVQLAESDPIEPAEPSQAQDIETVASAFSPTAPLATFRIHVAAPTTATAPSDANPAAYGVHQVHWHPFPDLDLPLAEYACQIAERFDFATQLSEVSWPNNIARQPPGIVVIDPAFALNEAGMDTLRSIAKFPRWVLPLVVLSQPDDQQTRALVDRVRATLKAKDLPTESARKGARGVGSLDEFLSLVPVLVAEAERQYLRHRTSRSTLPRSSRRLRLGEAEGLDGTAVS